MLKKGDIVLMDGERSRVIGSWGQGKHLLFRLEDGREVIDLDKRVESGEVQVIKDEPRIVRPKPVRFEDAEEEDEADDS